MSARIAFQGEPGAYSHQACVQARPGMEILPCRTFEDVIAAVHDGDAELAALPVENSTFGRVPDNHLLLPNSGLFIQDEVFVRVEIALLVVPGAKLSDVTRAMSHPVLLGQCSQYLRQHRIERIVGADTAGSAREVAEAGDPTMAALAAPLAGEIYGLESIVTGIEDQRNNTTRFLIMGREPVMERRGGAEGSGKMVTSFVFQVRNIPAALYKAMGGFATNGVNMTKLESYMVGGSFTATQFYADVEGHPEDDNLRRALEELRYFTSSLKILGTYPADPRRKG